MFKWLKKLFSAPCEEIKEGDKVLCYQCGKECICGSVCLLCGFPSPGQSEIIEKGL